MISAALPWIGEGHYKRMFTIPADCSGHAELVFDGAMAEPTVYVNQQKAGYWAYDYNTFRIDITPFIHQGKNLLEVDLNNVEESSRWYPGAGIYRPVTLVLTPKADSTAGEHSSAPQRLTDKRLRWLLLPKQSK